MAKRSLIVFALTLVLVTSAVPIRHVHGILMTPDEVATLDATSRDDDGQSKGDNTFVRVLKAPVKAIGRLFGLGKKDENKLERLSRKDVKKFESVGTEKIADARTTGFETPAAAAPATQNAPVVDPALASAQENLERGRALLQQLQLVALHAPDRPADVLHGIAAGYEMLRAEAQKTLCCPTHTDALLQEFDAALGQSFHLRDTPGLLRIVCGELFCALDLRCERCPARMVRRQIAFVGCEQKAALAGFGIGDCHQDSIQTFDHLMRVIDPLRTICEAIHAHQRRRGNDRQQQ